MLAVTPYPMMEACQKKVYKADRQTNVASITSPWARRERRILGDVGVHGRGTIAWRYTVSPYSNSIGNGRQSGTSKEKE